MNRKAALWPIAIVGVLGVTVAANGVLIYQANRGNVALESDYYRKAVQWDSTLAQAARNAELGWKITASLGVDGRLTARLENGAGHPIAGAAVSVEGFAVAYANGAFAVDLEPVDGAGYGGSIRLTHGGLHELRFRASKNGERFTATLRGAPGASFVPPP
jgi:nitrogen fixation protein FixH